MGSAPSSVSLALWFRTKSKSFQLLTLSCISWAGFYQNEMLRVEVTSELTRGSQVVQRLHSIWSEPCSPLGGSTWQGHSLWMLGCPEREMNAVSCSESFHTIAWLRLCRGKAACGCPTFCLCQHLKYWLEKGREVLWVGTDLEMTSPLQTEPRPMGSFKIQWWRRADR